MGKAWHGRIHPPEAVQQARTGIELGTLTRNHVPLVATLTPRLVSGTLSLRDLAQFSSERWIQLFQSEDPAGGLIGVPENTEGETSEEKFTAFATILEKHFERAYPTAALAGRIMQTDNRAPQLTAEVATFLNTNPEFSLDQTRIDHYFGEKNIPRGDTSLVHQLSAVQRIFALSPTFTSTNELLSRRGLTSRSTCTSSGRAN